MNSWEEGAYAGILGYSNLPQDIAEDPTADGIVLKYNTVPGGSFPPFNLGRVSQQAIFSLSLAHPLHLDSYPRSWPLAGS